MAILFLDLDRFKQVNETSASPEGDRLLQAFSERLKGHVRESDIVARTSDNELMAILPNITRDENTSAKR